MLYAALARHSFRRYSTYRAATIAGCFTNTVFGFVLAFTYIALWKARPDLGGYDAVDAVTYVWIGQSLLATTAGWGGGFERELAERIRSGDVAVDLYRPMDFQLWWLATDLGRAAFQLLARGIPPTLVASLAFDLRLPTEPFTWAAGLLSIFLAVVVSFSIRYLVGLSGFWLLDPRGLERVSAIVAGFLSGQMLPLNIFPGWLGELARALPWSTFLQVPADILLGKHAGLGLLGVFAFQASWALALLAAGRLLTRLATRRVVVQGG